MLLTRMPTNFFFNIWNDDSPVIHALTVGTGAQSNLNISLLSLRKLPKKYPLEKTDVLPTCIFGQRNGDNYKENYFKKT